MQNRKYKMRRFSSIINGGLFLLGSYTFIEESQWMFALLSFVAAILNFYALLPNMQQNLKLNLILNIFNALVAFALMYSFYLKGTDYLHYVWLVAALMFLFRSFMIFVMIRKTT